MIGLDSSLTILKRLLYISHRGKVGYKYGKRQDYVAHLDINVSIGKREKNSSVTASILENLVQVN